MKRQEIINQLNFEIKKLGEIIVELPWENSFFYKYWLSQTYFLIQHTTKLLSLSAAKLPLNLRDHHYTMLKHIEGELNHDQMPLKDLKDLDSEIEEFVKLPETEMIYQLQYYWIDYESPLSLCGYAFLLEGTAKFFGPALLAKLERKYGKKGSLFLRVHAAVDQEHYEDGQKFLDTLTDEDLSFIIRNMQQSGFLYSQMLERLVQITAVQTERMAS